MLRTILILLILPFPNTAYSAQECVVLLHGLARTENSMEKLAKSLSKENYHVINYGYPSTEYDIETLAKTHIPLAIEKCDSAKKINFVTHSMGAIILRQYLKHNEIEKLHRVVMLGPPNKGSQVVDNLRNMPGFKLINGPAGIQLGTTENDIPSSLGPVKGEVEVGIIAGTKTINLMLSLFLPNPDDGKVSVENTNLEVMKEHISIKVSHTFLMKNKLVISKVLLFLSNGTFSTGSE